MAQCLSRSLVDVLGNCCVLEGANRDAEGEGAEIPCAEELSSLCFAQTSPSGSVLCRHRGGDRRAPDFGLIAVLGFYFLSKPGSGSSPCSPGAAGLSCCPCRAQHPEQLCAWGPWAIRSSSSSCPHPAPKARLCPASGHLMLLPGTA